jgi:hypothetical protein
VVYTPYFIRKYKNVKQSRIMIKYTVYFILYLKIKIYQTTILPVAVYEWKLDLPQYGNRLRVFEDRVLRRSGSKGDETHEAVESCPVRNFIICTPCHILLD